MSGGNRMKREKNNSVIITRQEHGLSRKLMSPNALRTLYRLRDNGFVGYLVVGSVCATSCSDASRRISTW